LIFANRDKDLPAFEELFLYVCPKFISANPLPYEDPEQATSYAKYPRWSPRSATSMFVANMRVQAAVLTLRSFLNLCMSLNAAKLASFLDADEGRWYSR
jgi:translation initiation factor 3 subunit L